MTSVWHYLLGRRVNSSLQNTEFPPNPHINSLHLLSGNKCLRSTKTPCRCTVMTEGLNAFSTCILTSDTVSAVKHESAASHSCALHKRWHHVGSAWVLGAQLAICICHFESVTLAYIYFWRSIFNRALCCVQVTSSIVALTPGRKKTKH